MTKITSLSGSHELLPQLPRTATAKLLRRQFAPLAPASAAPAGFAV